MGMRANPTASAYFENVKVPKENLLGPLHGGFKVAMQILNSGRSGLGGGCVGAMKSLIGLSAGYATERQQFGEPIGSFGLIKQKVGHMVVDCYAAESAVNLVAALSDRGYDDYSVEAAILKIFATEALWRTPTRPCRRRAATATCASTRTSAPSATAGSTASSRAPTRCCGCSWRSPP